RQRQERAAIRRGRLREWAGGAAQSVTERASELGRGLAARGQRAVEERRARREAQRAAERHEGTFSVRLPPSGSRQQAAVGRAEERELPRPPSIDQHEPARPEESRAPDDLELKDREREPRPRLDFPDEF